MKIKSFLCTIILCMPIGLYGQPEPQPLATLNIQEISLDQQLNALSSPINWNYGGGIQSWYRKYNNYLYKDFLANDFSHVIQILQYSKKVYQPGNYVYAATKLFSKKIKDVKNQDIPYVNAYAFSDMVAQLPPILKDTFSTHKKELRGALHGAIKQSLHDLLHEQAAMRKRNNPTKDILYDAIYLQFSELKRDPEAFFDQLSDTIATALLDDSVESTAEAFSHKISAAVEQAYSLDAELINIEKLRQTIVRFLEVTMNQIIWSPRDGVGVWSSVKQIANNLHDLLDADIFDDPDDLNDLYWSLMHRFCFFLDLHGAGMPIDVYEAIQSDLNANSIALLTLEEQEEFMETKANRLSRVVAENVAKIKAQQHGLVPKEIIT